MAMIAAKTSQQSAAKKVDQIIKTETDPVRKQKLTDLQSQIRDLGYKLDTATGKIAWYESQYQQLYLENSNLLKTVATVTQERDDARKQTATAKQETKAVKVEAHDNAVGRDFWLRLFAVIAAYKVGRASWKACVTPVSGPYGALVPVGLTAIAYGSVYFIGRIVTGWVVDLCAKIPLLDWIL